VPNILTSKLTIVPDISYYVGELVRCTRYKGYDNNVHSWFQKNSVVSN